MSIGVVVLGAEGLTLDLDGRRVVDEVSLDLRAGEVLALVGPNGAGKSSLLSLLGGERRPSDGKVFITDRELDAYTPVELARRRAVLTQDNQLSFPFRVRQVVEMGRNPWLRTPEFDRDEAAVISAVARADIAHLLDRRFTELSGGERARVSLARVLAQDTPVVMLDEPTAALDLRHQEDVLRIVRALAAAGRAVVIVLHDLSLAAAAADRVGVLSRGRLVAIGPPAQVLRPALLSEVYELAVDVVDHEGRLLVVPSRP